MRAIVARRVSTAEQGDSGLGMAAQLESCRRWCEGHGAELVGPYDDEVCGAESLDKRSGLLEALGQLRKGDVLLVAKRDRLGRDPILCAMVEASAKRKGARVVSAAGEGTDDDDPTSILMRRIVDAFAEYERLIIGARTKSALRAKIRKGERCGRLRYGYDLGTDGKTLVENPQEQEGLRLIDYYRKVGLTLRQVAAELTRRQIRTKDGNTAWTHTAVARILGRQTATV